MRLVLAFDIDAVLVDPDPDVLGPLEESWRGAKLLVDTGLLAALAVDFELVVVTGRSREELEDLEQRLQHRFSRATTADEMPSTEPEALLRLLHPDVELALVLGPSLEALAAQARFFTRVPLVHLAPERPWEFLQELRVEPWEAAAIAEAWGGRRDQ